MSDYIFILPDFFSKLSRKSTNFLGKSQFWSHDTFVCVCVCLAHFRCGLSGWDHQCVYSMSAAWGFLTGVKDVFGHAAGWGRGKPGEEPAWICCESYLEHVFKQPVTMSLSKMPAPKITTEVETGSTFCPLAATTSHMNTVNYTTHCRTMHPVMLNTSDSIHHSRQLKICYWISRKPQKKTHPERKGKWLEQFHTAYY